MLNEFHDWTRSQDPELYTCEVCGQVSSIDDEEFREKCPALAQDEDEWRFRKQNMSGQIEHGN